MNWDRVRRENQATADRRADKEANSPRKAFLAKFRSTCGTCNATINVGDGVASTLVGGKRVYHHERCIYPVADAPAINLEQAAATLAGGIPDGTCHGITKAGKPCAGGAKRGEMFCGPHLDKMLHDAQPKPPAAPNAAAYDPYYDDPF